MPTQLGAEQKLNLYKHEVSKKMKAIEEELSKLRERVLELEMDGRVRNDGPYMGPIGCPP
jgi:hypothetical protein